MKKLLTIIAIYAAPQVILPLFIDQNTAVYGLLLSTLILWLTELISLAYTSLLIPLLGSFLGIASFKNLLGSFAHPILYLFISCFFLSIAFSKSGLDKRISLFILKNKNFSRTSLHLLISVALLSWALSMWISNTASCAILIPILIGLANQKEIAISANGLKKLLITCAYGASIGGLVTPVGSPPNMLALNLFEKNGMSLSFLQWMSISLPVSLIMLVLLLLILNFLFPEEKVEINNETFKLSYKALGKLSVEEKITLSTFLFTVILWIFPKIFSVVGIPKLSLAQAGLFGTVPLFIYSISNKESLLKWSEVQKKIDWGIIFLFAGGLTLGSIMDQTGVAKDISEILFKDTSSILILGITITFFAIILSELGSNTASAALILPLISSMASTTTTETFMFYTLCATFGASFGFMLPISTPPNALVFSTGRIEIKDLIKAGVLFDILGLLIIVLGLKLVL